MVEAPYEKAIEETAKAVQTVTPVVDKYGDRLAAFLHKVIGEPLEHLGGALSDSAQLFRYENALRLADRVDEIHRKRQISGATILIPPRLAIPLLENATLESDPTLADMWAGLIANATDPTRRVQARRTFTQLLSSLEPIDARVLMEIERSGLENPGRNLSSQIDAEETWRPKWPTLSSISASLGIDPEDITLALENLERLGLAWDYNPGTGTPVPLTHPHASIQLTATGEALLTACRT